MDLDLLLKLRIVVARCGEMDRLKWWNTKGQLGPLGHAALRRGFPRTHWFVQARSVFAVAEHRCQEVFGAPGTVNLWRFSEDIEEQFDARWEHWLDHAANWVPFFERVSKATASVDKLLSELDLIGNAEIEALGRLRRSADGRAVQLPGVFGGTDGDARLLAVAFARGETADLAVPYLRVGE
jgi:hypothetical protein